MMPNFLNAVILLFNDLYKEEKDQEEFKKNIETKFPYNVLLALHDDNDFNLWLRYVVLQLVIMSAEDLYGDRDTAFTIHPNPDLKSSPRSRIAPELNNHKNIIVCIGPYVSTWEDFFYEICHESIHLLNPVIDIENNPASSLDEGVAVKFAEAMYNKFIKPYHKYPANNSPLYGYSRNNNYKKAYEIADKIPDEALFSIRKEFDAFTRIINNSKLKEMAGPYINDDEIRYISDNFKY